MTSRSLILAAFSVCALALPAMAETVKVDLSAVTADGVGAVLGALTLSDSAGGLKISYDLHGLPPGAHGLHIHANGTCAPGPNKDGKLIAAGAAGGHFDPLGKGKHLGPMGDGHMGDLPLISADATGAAKGELLAPHLMSVSALRGHVVMLHAGGDNYSDDPAPLGGGGARIACGPIN
eukprot:gene16892-17079_t